MAIAVESVSTNAMGIGGVLTKPTGLAVGDSMVAIMVAETTADLSAPSGWATVSTSDNPTYSKTKLFTKIADAGDVATSTFTFTGTDIRGGILYRISGASLENSFVQVGDPVGEQSLIIIWANSGDNGGRTVTYNAYTASGGVSPTFTERLDSSEATGLTTCFGVADGIYNSGATITSFGVTASGAIDENTSKMFVIPAQVNASAQATFLAVTPTLISPTGSNTDTATSTLLEVSPTFHSPTAKSSSDSTQWTNETKPTTVWTNETL